MSEVHKFISVLKPAISSGSITFNFSSVNRATPITFNSTVAILTSDDEAAIAGKIIAQFLTNFGVTYTYSGTPDFTRDGPRAFTFALTQTAHVITLFSEAQFAIKVTNNPTGARIEIAEFPIYARFCDLEETAPFVGVPLTAADGSSFNDNQLAKLLRIGSQQVVSIAGEYFVGSTYMHEEHGFMWDSMTLMHTPILTYNPPYVRGSSFAVSGIAEGTAISSGYRVDDETGVVLFSPFGVEPYKLRAGDRYNFIKMSYVAGLTGIPDGLQMESIRAASLFGIPLLIGAVKGGSGQVTLDRRQATAAIRGNLEAIGLL